jgi:hypothetical protein
MSYSVVPTVATGDLWSAANHNTYIRDNFAAGVPDIFTAAGQIVYSTGADAAAVLNAPGAASVLKHSGAALSWLDLLEIPGLLHTKGNADFAPAQSVTGTTWTDVTGATVTLSLSKTCTVMLWAFGVIRVSAAGYGAQVRGSIDGTVDPTYSTPFSGDAAYNPVMYFWYRTGIAAGSRVVKLQFNCSGAATAYFERGRIMGLAMVE